MAILILFFLLLPLDVHAFMADQEVELLQQTVAGWSVGERVAFWAEKFVGTPYDPDPLGEYVRKSVVVADDRVDCMYHAFRSVELALGRTPSEAVAAALDKRFPDKGILEGEKVQNYEERFRYGEDMLESGKWGREITTELGPTVSIPGSRGRTRVLMIRRQAVAGIAGKLRNGDLVFFVKDPAKRTVGEIVGHIGIIKVEENDTYLINASGRKNRGGTVKKILLSDYSRGMPFAGIRVSRLE